MRRSLAILLTGGLLLLGSLPLASGAIAATTIAPTTTCSNGVDNTGGLGLICEVTVVNTFTASGGSAAVTVRECHGPAGVPETACTTTPSLLSEPVTAVTQCNDSANGAGATLRCSVEVTNNFVDIDPGPTDATVNQCVGSGGGGGIAIVCDPFPEAIDGATITQCNGSANGGGVVTPSTCTATGTKSSALAVTINQCNGSANGGGALIICSANITNNAVTAGPTPTPTTGPTSGPTSRPTPPATDTLATTDVPGSGTTPVVFVVTFLAGILLLAFVIGVRRPRRDPRSGGK